MFIDYAIEPLRAEAPLDTPSTPYVDAVLAARYDNAVVASNEVGVCTPAQ